MIKPTIGRVVWYHPPFIADSDSQDEQHAKIAQLERTNAALLGALKEIDRSWTSDGWTPENAKARTVFTDDTIERWKRMRAAIAEAETTGSRVSEAEKENN